MALASWGKRGALENAKAGKPLWKICQNNYRTEGHMASVRLERVSKYYGPVCAVKDFSLTCADGEMLALLGPSGCGKTSTLKMIAGVEDISQGEIYFDENPVSGLEPGARNIAMVFEDYALYPNMSVAQNIAFPLKLRKLPVKEIKARIEPVLDLLSLEPMANSNVRQLSGGAQQRVSIGRALVREPELIIFDEPLSHLDGDQKVQLRTEIKRLQQTMGLTAILVTHDQTEAIAMADKVAVMNQGELQQIDLPQNLYDRPANLFTANFIGEPPMNLLNAKMRKSAKGLEISGSGWSVSPKKTIAGHLQSRGHNGDLILGVRPEHIDVSQTASSRKMAISGSITRSEFRGETRILTVALGSSGTQITAEIDAAQPVPPKGKVSLRIPDQALNIFDAGSGNNLLI